jgi:hypothetical protein
MKTFEQLSAEWHQIDGTDIPPHIANLPLSQIEQALEFKRRKYQPVSETSGNDDSLAFEDNHNNLT